MPPENHERDKPVIIVTDDRRASRHMIRNILEPEGYNVFEAENGKNALELCKSLQPELLLLDIIMPVMGGLEACRRLMEEGYGKQMPVLMFTAYNEGREVEKAFEAGASDFINKPINPEELRHRVSRLLHLGRLERKRLAAEAELQSSYEEIQLLSRKILNAYEEERVRLARELHDEVGMTLTTIKLNLQLLNKEVKENSGQHHKKMTEVIASLSGLQETIRSKALFLRPPSLDELGLFAVIENMVSEFSRHTGIKSKLRTTGTPEGVPVEVETAIYRCIQEALTNIARHARADSFSVELDFSGNPGRVSIIDNGIGFNTDEINPDGKHLGLQGMQERVALLSGELILESKPGKGTGIQIVIPVSDREN